MRHRHRMRGLAAFSAVTGLVSAVALSSPVAAHAAAGTGTPAAAGTAAPADPSRIANPDQILPADWKSSKDRAVTVIGDDNGLNVLVADSSSAYQWRTAASLSEPGFDTPQWIGQDCVTGSGRYAAVVYAPWSAANDADAFNHGSFAAIVDLDDGSVRKLPDLVSLAYYSPGCGTGDTVAFSAFDDDTASPATKLELVNAATGAVTQRSSMSGQLTSPVPYGSGIAAADGDQLVQVDAAGARQVLGTERGVPFELHPDRQGGLAFQVPVGSGKTQLDRFAKGASTVVGTGDLGAVQLRGAAGNVFVIGPQTSDITLGTRQSGGWHAIGGPADATPSTTGRLDLTSVSNHVSASVLKSSTADSAADLISIAATVVGSGKKASFDLAPQAAKPAADQAASPALGRLASGSAASGTGSGAKQKTTVKPSVSTLSSGYSTTNADDSANPDDVTWDPVRGCAVARNDPTIQTFQANAKQIEWAADLAVQNALTITRTANWENSGMPSSWTIQGSNGMFPLPALDAPAGDPTTVPVQVLLGVLAQESNTMQASSHEVDGETGNFNQGGFYGNVSTSTPPPGTTFSDSDCGYGVGQITTGMTIGYTKPLADGNPSYTVAEEQQAIATDYATNIAATLNMLIDKWNELYKAGIIANGADPQYVQNWWFAAWDFNSGLQPGSASLGNTTGCTPSASCTDGAGHWGLGWTNNPANPSYPADRALFNNSNADTRAPQQWSYEEKVMGWAVTPLVRYDYADGAWESAYAAEVFPNGAPIADSFPATLSAFCSTLDNCQPDGATDSTGTADTAGLCELSNFHCWIHNWVSWQTNCLKYCGTAVITYGPTSTEPAAHNIYPSDGCTTAGSGTGDTLPSGAVIVDSAQSLGQAACAGQTASWTPQGKMSFFFPESENPSCTSECVTNQGKIDFHQAGGGLDGHMWFAHDITTPSDSGTTYVDDSMTATWTPPSTTTGWTRIEVHIPQSGATTRLADYQINLGGTQGSRHRHVNQYLNQNTWVDLGSFDLASGAAVSLSNYNSYATAGDGGDVAFDAVAFVPTVKPVVNYVALGDSYSAGYGLAPYTSDSNITYNNGASDYCGRSATEAYPELLTYPGLGSTPISTVFADNGAANYAFIACSGAQTVDMTASAVLPGNTWNTDWGSTAANNSDYGELEQIDASGWLDADTTLVTLTIGGNDARFSDIIAGCIETATPCTAADYHLTRGNGTVDPQVLTTYEPEVINAEENQLELVYAAIHQKAPNAKVLVLGYPHLFPADPGSTSCLLLDDPDVASASMWMNTMSDDLNASIQNAISAVKQNNPSMNIQFVDVRPTFTGHEVCSGDPFLNGVVVNGSGAFHPMANGAAAEAAQLNTLLNP